MRMFEVELSRPGPLSPAVFSPVKDGQKRTYLRSQLARRRRCHGFGFQLLRERNGVSKEIGLANFGKLDVIE